MKTRLWGALSACVLTLFTSAIHAVVLPLEGRLEKGLGSGVFLAYYDPNLDITWAADANTNGLMNWVTANAWAEGQKIGGVRGWRLPSANVNDDGTIVDCSGGGVSGCADNEMGYLFWEEGITGAAPSPFSNLQSGWPSDSDHPHYYWSGTTPPGTTLSRYGFRFDTGFWTWNHLSNISFFAWAVHSGDVPLQAVPLPAAVWLFGSGLLALAGLGKQRRR